MKIREIYEFSDTAIMIEWDDGHESIYLYEELRQACPCAVCNQARKSKQGRFSFKRAIPMGVPSSNTMPENIERVGNYAIRFKWNDGHDTGIYSFELLRELCKCEQCRPAG